MLPGRRPGSAGHQVTHQLRFLLKWRDGEALHQLRFLLKWRDGEALSAYGAAEAGRDYNTVDLSERRLREVYLPPFAAGIGAVAGAVIRLPRGSEHHPDRERLAARFELFRRVA